MRFYKLGENCYQGIVEFHSFLYRLKGYIKKHRGDGPRCFFVGMWCCAEEMVRRGDVVPLRSGGGLAFQDFEGGARGGAEHVDAGSQTFERFCGLDSGAERDAVN